MPQRKHSGRRSTTRSAFTLIEVLLVLIILVVMGSLAFKQVSGIQDRALRDAAKVQVNNVEDAVKYYQLHNNEYPSRLEDLWEQPSEATLAEKWAGPYLDELKEDPWGNPYSYTREGKNNPNKFDVWSNGPDEKSGTEDDIGNWETQS